MPPIPGAGVGRAPARAGEAAPRPYKVGRSSTSAPRGRLRSGDRPRFVGVRRCLTRRPGRAGRPPPACDVGRGHRRILARNPNVAAPLARAGEAAPRPYTMGGAAPVPHLPAPVGRYPPFCRGQALPDPPARQGRQTTNRVRWCRDDRRQDRRTARCARTLPRPWRGRARQRLAPTRLGGPAPVRCMAGSGRVTGPVL
jgi:hypothetical protein